MLHLCQSLMDENELKRSLDDDRAGAVATFEGRVRNHNDGKAVLELVYEAYDELADKEAAAILREAHEQFDILHAVLRHRTGPIAIGELAVFVGVSSAHRDAAFQACRFIIEAAKVRLPIWKKETYDDDTTVWVNCQTCAHRHDESGKHSAKDGGASSTVRQKNECHTESKQAVRQP